MRSRLPRAIRQPDPIAARSSTSGGVQSAAMTASVAGAAVRASTRGQSRAAASTGATAASATRLTGAGGTGTQVTRQLAIAIPEPGDEQAEERVRFNGRRERPGSEEAPAAPDPADDGRRYGGGSAIDREEGARPVGHSAMLAGRSR